MQDGPPGTTLTIDRVFSSLMIAMLPGVTNLYALIGLFAVNAAMILFG